MCFVFYIFKTKIITRYLLIVNYNRILFFYFINISFWEITRVIILVFSAKMNQNKGLDNPTG